jgi:TPR repeat protein
MDVAQAKKLYGRSIELGMPQGYEYLGGLYEHGNGAKKDEKEAARLIKRQQKWASIFLKRSWKLL